MSPAAYSRLSKLGRLVRHYQAFTNPVASFLSGAGTTVGYVFPCLRPAKIERPAVDYWRLWATQLAMSCRPLSYTSSIRETQRAGPFHGNTFVVTGIVGKRE